jgi:hypothetical protein
MTSPSIVRLAVPEDSVELWRLVLQLYNENGIFKLSPGKVDWLMKRALFSEMIPEGDEGPRGVIGVIGPTGALEAFVFIMVGTHWYTEEHCLEEIAVYTDSEYRKSNHTKAMVQWMAGQSEKTGLKLITGIMSNHRTEAKCRLYRRMLPKIGEFFMVHPSGNNLSLVSASS